MKLTSFQYSDANYNESKSQTISMPFDPSAAMILEIVQIQAHQLVQFNCRTYTYLLTIKIYWYVQLCLVYII